MNRCFGLIGGLGVGAAVHYYRELVKGHRATGTPLRLLMAHAEVERVFRYAQAGEPALLAEYLAALIRSLRDGGAEVAAVPAVMPHLAINELLEITPLPLVNLLEVVDQEVRSRGFRRVSLFGTRFSVESAMFGQVRSADVVIPRPEEVDYIHRIYSEMVLKGEGTAEQHDGLTRLAHTLCEREKLDAILLAGTDLALIFNESNTDFPHVDCSQVHIDAILRVLVE